MSYTLQSNELRLFFSNVINPSFYLMFFVVVLCFCCQYCSFSYFRALSCIPTTPISVETVLVLELLTLESLSAILEYMFALQQQEKS